VLSKKLNHGYFQFWKSGTPQASVKSMVLPLAFGIASKSRVLISSSESLRIDILDLIRA